MKVYFKLSKKKLANSNIANLTPNKLYEATLYMRHTNLYTISNDIGFECILYINRGEPCGHLDHQTNWIKKRVSKPTKSPTSGKV